eukprot:357975-Lingulodinium_polyedra.AAC.1
MPAGQGALTAARGRVCPHGTRERSTMRSARSAVPVRRAPGTSCNGARQSRQPGPILSAGE